MKFRYIFSFILVVFILAAGVLFFTNPDEQAHKRFIKEKFITIFNQKVDQELNEIENPNIKLWGYIGKKFFPAAGEKMINNLIDSHVRRKNYYLFSTIQVLYKEKWNTIGIGILDKMYLFPKVEEELKKLDLKDQAHKLLK